MSIELELSDGSVLELDDNTPPDMVQRLGQRAEHHVQMEKSRGSDTLDAASAGLSGFNRGVARVFEAPTNLARFGANSLAHALGYPDVVNPRGMLERGMEEADAIQPTRGWNKTAAFGQGVGSGVAGGVVAAPAAALAETAGLPITAAVLDALAPSTSLEGGTLKAGADTAKFLGQQAAGTAAGMAGAAGGEAIASQFSDDEHAKELGRILGGFAAPMAPSVAWGATRGAIRHALGREGTDSRNAYNTLVDANITPTPGLVGNRNMARIENTYSQFPVVGFIPQRRARRSFTDFQDELYRAADEINPAPTDRLPTEPPKADAVGAQMRNAARSGERNLYDPESGYFAHRYGQVFDPVPINTLVRRENLDRELQAQNDPWTGESASTNQSVNQFVRDQIDAKTLTPQGPAGPGNTPVVGPQGPVQPDPAAVISPGVPINVAKKARTEAFYDAEGGKMVGGATEGIRKAWTRDMEDALMNDPPMVRAFPDPRDRLAQVERLRVADTEYAMAGAKDVSPAGIVRQGDRYYVGGDKKALNDIKTTEGENAVFSQGSTPDSMAALQRTDPGNYPHLAAETMRLKAQLRMANGNVNVSPQGFARWWDSLSDNAKMIYANEGFDPRRSIPANEVDTRAYGPPDPVQPPRPVIERLNNLSKAGQLFHERGLEAGPSGTAPTLATIGVGTGLFTNTAKTLAALASGGLGGAAVSSEELAKILAGAERPTAERLAQAGMRQGVRQGAGGLTWPAW